MKCESKFDYGDRCYIDHDESVVGVVTSFQFRMSRVEAVVELSWMHNGDAKSGWFEEWRLVKVEN